MSERKAMSSSFCRLPPSLLLLVAMGCSGPAAKPTADAGDSKPPAKAPSPAVDPQPPTKDVSPELAGDAEVVRTEEIWEALYIDDAKVGFVHAVTEQLQRGDRRLLRFKITHESEVQRFGQKTPQRVVAQYVQNDDGELVEFNSRIHAGGEAIKSSGRIVKGKLRLETHAGSQKQIEMIDWEKEWGGFLADVRSLRSAPLEIGERRKLTMLAPVLNRPAEVTLQAEEWEDVRLMSGETKRLLRVSQQLLLARVPIQSIHWCDAKGEILKSSVPSLNQTSYRTTREQAMAPNQVAEFDLGEATIVSIARALPDAHRTQRVVYRVSLTDSDPAEYFAQGASQKVTSLDKNSAEIVVQSIRGDDKLAPIAKDTPVDAKDLAANALVQSNDAAIAKMAQRAAENADHWKLALELEGIVHRAIAKKNFSQAFASAADVAKSLEGDCTEHSVLLAALCRARKIPARVAIGLVYYPAKKGLAYHMWNEVWIKDRWIPLDATLGKGGIGAAHLKIAATNLNGASPYEAFLPVIPLLRSLKVEIVEVK